MITPTSTTIGDFTVTTVISGMPYYQNGYVVRHDPTGEQVVIDPGGKPSAFVDAVNGGGGTCLGVWLTHGHPDHIAGVRGVQAALGLGCLAHEGERPLIERADEWSRALTGVPLKGPENCLYFGDDPALTLGGTPVRVLDCPGHTPGGVTYAFDGLAFTGDTLFNRGVGRTDFPGGNTQTLWDSIGRLVKDLPGETVLFSGHGPTWTVTEAQEWWRHMA